MQFLTNEEADKWVLDYIYEFEILLALEKIWPER
jgi:hypothetical protein